MSASHSIRNPIGNLSLERPHACGQNNNKNKVKAKENQALS